MSTNSSLTANDHLKKQQAVKSQLISQNKSDREKAASVIQSSTQLDDVVLDLRIGRALRNLVRAYRFSRDCGRPKWDFAVELSDLELIGISHDEIRWLVGKGLIEHAQEIASTGRMRRAFDSHGGFTFSDKSCFVITISGLQLFKTLDIKSDFDTNRNCIHTANRNPRVPHWDGQRHELRVGSVVVKRFKWRAVNQEAILTAFQEDGWPAHIDDPLPPVPDTEPKRRLSDAIKCLNRKQQNAILRFSGDGTGQGVLWDLIDADTSL